MKIREHAPVLDSILEDWRPALGESAIAYENHCYRAPKFCLAFRDESAETTSKVSIAAAFPDLGIWANNTYDYPDPSKQLAHQYPGQQESRCMERRNRNHDRAAPQAYEMQQ